MQCLLWQIVPCFVVHCGLGKMAQCFVFITELLLVLSVFNCFYYSSTAETTSFERIDCVRVLFRKHTWQWSLYGLPFHLCRRRCTHAVMTVCCLMTRHINQNHRARGPASSFCCCYYLLELNKIQDPLRISVSVY